MAKYFSSFCRIERESWQDQNHFSPGKECRSNFKMAESNSTTEKKKICNEITIELVEKSCMSHLFRHASEITRETKGGYLEGKIRFPATQNFPVYLRLSLIPTNIDAKENPLFIHPNLLHINMKLNKKNRKLNVSDVLLNSSC